ncbi:transposase [Oesophagostomum dentatum]|uniref:Transposase n=1 Tax=Oesophagostomum dentatum TaxID=61180 RepID=A0A0B1TFP7_OESDE|nr:transposase [Oesophagostomum dentatum]
MYLFSSSTLTVTPQETFLGWPVGIDDDPLMALIEADRHVAVRELTKKTNASTETVYEHTKKFGLQPVTGDEKWIVYNNVTRKRSWSKPDEPGQTMSRADLHQKIMLPVWWDCKGVIYFGVLPRNQNVTSDLCSRQLMKLDEAI